MISVIIPTLNEAEYLEATLRSIHKNDTPHEIIVVDGHSEDSTEEIARSHGAKVSLSHRQQRAYQQHQGAQKASGSLLLFLHADTILGARSLGKMDSKMRRSSYVGGAFSRRFEHPSRVLILTSWLADWRVRILGLALGDQGIFVRTKIYEQLGGFSDLDIFEDLEFSQRLRQAGRTTLVTPPIRSSGRRFGQRPLYRSIRDGIATIRFLSRIRRSSRSLGVPCKEP